MTRDSDGYDVGVGAAFDFTNLIRGEAFVGYLEQEYDQVGFQKVDGIDFGLNGEWYASELTTVTAGINRTVEESSSAVHRATWIPTTRLASPTNYSATLS